MTNQHVTPHPDGGWQVKAEGSSKATVRTDTKAQAFEIARDIARNQKSELLVHNKDGQISDKRSFGNDPYPPKG